MLCKVKENIKHSEIGDPYLFSTWADEATANSKMLFRHYNNINQ